MAEKKVATTEKVVNKKSKEETIVDDKETMIDDKLKAENDALKKKINDIQAQIDRMLEMQSQPQTQVVNTNKANRTVKVTSLLSCAYVLSTSTNSKKGKTYTFDKFGDSKMIRMNDMVDILSLYQHQFEEGMAIFENRQDAIDLDVEYIFDLAPTKEYMERVILLKSYDDVDFILGLSKDMQENVMTLIAENIKNGVNYDYNIIEKLKNEGLDVTQLVDRLKAFEVEE